VQARVIAVGLDPLDTLQRNDAHSTRIAYNELSGLGIRGQGFVCRQRANPSAKLGEATFAHCVHRALERGRRGAAYRPA
jgi:hypothetical protein